MRGRILTLCLAMLASPTLATAVELGDGRLNVNGNGAWAYQRTDRGRYLAHANGDWDTAMFDLLLSARPSERLVITAQLGFDPEEIGLEWGFAEWRFSDLARARAGKVKHPFGNYAETQFVGTARPFFTLPTTAYGPAEVAATAVNGVSLTGEWFSEGGWGLGYDAYGGSITLEVYEPYDTLVTGEPAAGEEATDHLENVVGGRVSLTTPAGVVLRFSGYGGRIATDEGAFTMVTSGVSAFYRGERLWVSAEAFHSGRYGFDRHVAAYAEAAYFVLPKLQLAARWELSRVRLDDYHETSPLLRHDEAAVGVNWWFSPELVVKASAHGVRGFRFAEERAGSGDRTLLFVAGAQFTF